MVGQWFVRYLGDHPLFDLKVLAASERSAGGVYGELVKWKVDGGFPERFRREPVLSMDPAVFADHGVEVLFSALPADTALKVERALAARGFKVFSNASAFRMDADVPILIPEVNADHVALVERQPERKSSGGFVITNANCSATGLVLGLRPLQLRFGLSSVVVATCQSLSGAGYPGVPSLDILGNVVPYIEREDEKLQAETLKMLGSVTAEGTVRPAGFDIVASCSRVATRYGHLEAVVVELSRDAGEKEVASAFREFRSPFSGKLPTAPERPIIVREEPDRPQPILDCDAGEPASARGMSVSVGRIRKVGKRIRFFLLVHNTVRGAAGASVLNAEFARMRGLL